MLLRNIWISTGRVWQHDKATINILLKKNEMKKFRLILMVTLSMLILSCEKEMTIIEADVNYQNVLKSATNPMEKYDLDFIDGSVPGCIDSHVYGTVAYSSTENYSGEGTGSVKLSTEADRSWYKGYYEIDIKDGSEAILDGAYFRAYLKCSNGNVDDVGDTEIGVYNVTSGYYAGVATQSCSPTTGGYTLVSGDIYEAIDDAIGVLPNYFSWSDDYVVLVKHVNTNGNGDIYMDEVTLSMNPIYNSNFSSSTDGWVCVDWGSGGAGTFSYSNGQLTFDLTTEPTTGSNHRPILYYNNMVDNNKDYTIYMEGTGTVTAFNFNSTTGIEYFYDAQTNDEIDLNNGFMLLEGREAYRTSAADIFFYFSCDVDGIGYDQWEVSTIKIYEH
jgi:hypothetical protein